jgi:hypothetical protein
MFACGRACHRGALRIEIDLDASDPPEGRLRLPHGPEQAFVGWLGLMKALSDVLGPPVSGDATGELGASPSDFAGELDP